MNNNIEEQPKAAGAFLSEEQVTAVARTCYNRFDYTYGIRPSWPDSQTVQRLKKEEVRKVLESLAINGFIVMENGDNNDPTGNLRTVPSSKRRVRNP